MKNIADGYAYITAGGQTYELAPSFCNIANIGSPMEVIAVYKRLSMGVINTSTYCDVCTVLEACGLPGELYGGIKFSERQSKTLIAPGLLPIQDAYMLALHSLKHGISGTSEQVEENNEGKPQPVTEFDAYTHIINAMEHFGMSVEEAENLTMTKYVRLVSAKIKAHNQSKARKEPSKEEQQSAMDNYEIMRAQAEARAKAKAKNKG
jgi:hypothetical protein